MADHNTPVVAVEPATAPMARWIAVNAKFLYDHVLPSAVHTTPRLSGFGHNRVGLGEVGHRVVDLRTNHQNSCLWLKTVRGAETAPDTP